MYEGYKVIIIIIIMIRMIMIIIIMPGATAQWGPGPANRPLPHVHLSAEMNDLPPSSGMTLSQHDVVGFLDLNYLQIGGYSNSSRC